MFYVYIYIITTIRNGQEWRFCTVSASFGAVRPPKEDMFFSSKKTKAEREPPSNPLCRKAEPLQLLDLT